MTMIIVTATLPHSRSEGNFRNPEGRGAVRPTGSLRCGCIVEHGVRGGVPNRMVRAGADDAVVSDENMAAGVVLLSALYGLGHHLEFDEWLRRAGCDATANRPERDCRPSCK
jgi:hypothetical protein